MNRGTTQPVDQHQEQEEEEPNENTPLTTGVSNDAGDVESQSVQESQSAAGVRNDALTKWELKAWDEQKRWSRVANKKRREEVNYRKTKLRLSIGGVLLQTLASQIQGGKFLIGDFKISLPSFLGFDVYIRQILSYLAGISLLLIPYVNDNLSIDKISDRTDSRLVGEELLSEIWKSLAGIQPYKSRAEDAVLIFNKKIHNIIMTEAGIDEPRFSIHPICILPVDETEGNLKLAVKDQMPKYSDFLPKCMDSINKDTEMRARKNLYLEKRVGHDGLRRRKEKAKRFEELGDFWRTVELYLTVGSAIIGIVLSHADTRSDLAIWATVLTTAAAAVAAHITACSFDTNRNSLYGVALLLENLNREREQNLNETEEEWDHFVNKFEETLLCQTRKWRANMIEAVKAQPEQEGKDDLKQISSHS